MWKTCPFSCPIIYWPAFERVLNRSYQWRVMNMYLLYTRSPLKPKWRRIGKQRWQLRSSLYANIIQCNVVISLGKAQCRLPLSFYLFFLNHTSAFESSRVTQTPEFLSSHLLCTGALRKSIRSSAKKTCLLCKKRWSPSRPADRPTQDWLCRQAAHIPVRFVARLFVLVSNAHFL